MRAMVSFTLQEGGYTITPAENGADALTKLNGPCPYDLIIADINMPVMDGIDFIREARKQGAYKYTPILMLTTETSAERMSTAKAAGATGWLVKPFHPEQLLDATRRMFD